MSVRAALQTLVLLVMACASGCDQKMGTAGDVPPPVPLANQAKPIRTYDYTHTVVKSLGKVPAHRWPVAILRFGDTREIENVPFGEKEPPAAEQNQGSEVSVNVKIVGVEGAATPRPTEAPPQMHKRHREMLKHALVQSEAFTVLERERILEILRETNFGKTEYVDPVTSPEQGAIISVRYLIEGSLGRNEDSTLKNTVDQGTSYKDGTGPSNVSWVDNLFRTDKAKQYQVQKKLLDMRRSRLREKVTLSEYPMACYLSVYDVRTGQVVISVMGLGRNGLGAIDDAVDELVDGLCKNKCDVRVALVDGNQVYLDVGEAGGMQPGSRFQVLHYGDPIRNHNGQIVGHAESEAGEIEVTDVRRLYSIAKVIRKAGEIARGDGVRPAKH